MKNVKKVITLLLAATVVLSSSAAFAEESADADVTAVSEVEVVSEENGEIAEETVPEAAEKADKVEVKTANLGDFISDEENWAVNSGNELTFENGKIVNNNDGTAYIAYGENNFADTLVQYKQTFDFAEGKSWGGIVLNSSTYSSAVWSGGNGYLVVIKHDRIEIQRWSKGEQAILHVVANDFIKDKTAANISAGAINVDGGVNIFMFVDGKCVINLLDSEANAVKEGKYFTLYETAGSEIAAFDGEAIPAVPAELIFAGKANEGEEFSVDTTLVSFGNETESEYTYEWFFNNEASGTLNEIETSAKEEFGKKYVPAGQYEKSVGTGTTHTVAADEIGGYYVVEIKDADGNVVLKSTPVMVNNYNYLLSSTIILSIDCEYSFVNGIKSQIDPEDYNVSPAIVDSRTLVPVRFIAESLGADVEWDNDTKKITIKLNGEEIVMTLNETEYTVGGEKLELDVPAQVMNERTMVPVRVISEAFGKDVFWDGNNEVIIISDSDLGIDAEAEAATLEYLKSQILKRM